jgi:hypothetical protein
MTKIYESPDGGKTVYVREMGSLDRKPSYSEGIEDWNDHCLWIEIRKAAKKNPVLKKACDKVKILYRLSIDDPQ